jgi:predicted DNA-binding ribbon-helix-helix protein
VGNKEIMKPQEQTNDYKSSLISKNITINGRRTSVRLEPEMWQSLYEIAERERCTIHQLCSLIQMKKAKNSSLTAAIRVFLMLYYRAAATEEGHSKAAHGDFSHMCRRAGALPKGNNTNGHWSPHMPAGARRAPAAQPVLQVRYS